MTFPHLILEVRGGPRRGKKTALAPGDKLVVGRTDLADLPLPVDDRLSARHFELSWDGARASIRHVGGAAGTLLNGEAVRTADVHHGAWIRAGETDFMVYVEAHTPPPPDEEEDDDAPDDEPEPDAPPPFAEEPSEPEGPPPDWVEPEEAREERARFLASQAAHRRQEQRARKLRDQAAERALPILNGEENLHAVLDAARSPRILQVLQEAVEEHRSLYEGVKGEALAEAAPYLVKLSPGSRLLGQLVAEGWMRRWGIFIEGRVPERELRRHLRRFLMVEDDSGEPLYFRFYDPGVLRTFWPACSRRQRAELIGPVGAFLVEGERGEVLRLTSGGEIEPLEGAPRAP